MACTITSNGRPVFRRARLMRTARERALGLIGRQKLDLEEACVFPRCSSVHSCFMQTAIDVFHLDSTGMVLAAYTLHPWHLSRRIPGTTAVVEAAPHARLAKGIGIGDLMEWRN